MKRSKIEVNRTITREKQNYLYFQKHRCGDFTIDIDKVLLLVKLGQLSNPTRNYQNKRVILSKGVVISTVEKKLYFQSITSISIVIMSKPIVYGIDACAPTRAVLLTAKAIGLDFEYKIVNLSAGEHLTEEFLKKNIQHTVPVLEDNGEYLTDSHAICAYLIQKYGTGKDQVLYPGDLYQRALVDQKLHFDSGVLFPKLKNVVVSFMTDL